MTKHWPSPFYKVLYKHDSGVKLSLSVLRCVYIQEFAVLTPPLNHTSITPFLRLPSFILPQLSYPKPFACFNLPCMSLPSRPSKFVLPHHRVHGEATVRAATLLFSLPLIVTCSVLSQSAKNSLTVRNERGSPVSERGFPLGRLI